MFELPEILILAHQINIVLVGKRVSHGNLGNKPHKFVWYNRTHGEFSKLIAGKTAGKAYGRGRWLFLSLEPGYLLVLGELGGRLLYHPPTAIPPEAYHLLLKFEDGSALSAMTQMWGAMELYEKGLELERQYIKDMRLTPVDPGFTFEYFEALVESLIPLEKRSVKALLTQDQLIPGLGNSIAQDIMYNARLHPRRPLQKLNHQRRLDLYSAIINTVKEVIQKGGRYDEIDLFGQPGGYIRLMDKNSVGKLCSRCNGKIEKIQFLGGACYLCSGCQI